MGRIFKRERGIVRVLERKQQSFSRRSVREDYPDDGHLYTSVSRVSDEGHRLCLCFPFTPSSKTRIMKEPDQESIVVISYVNEEGNKTDFVFGAFLCTFREHLDKTTYNRHYLRHVTPDGPADNIGVEDKDEIVLLRDVFLPKLTHSQVLTLFRDVVVNGETAFDLVQRRIHKGQRKRRWDWIETHARLAPSKILNHPVHIEEVKQNIERGKEIKIEISEHLYNVTGTDLYLDICDAKDMVTAVPMAGDSSDKTKKITKHAKCWQIDKAGHLDFAAALSEVTNTKYIAVDEENNISLEPKTFRNGKQGVQRRQFWFGMYMTGSKIRFKSNEKYLAYDRERRRIKAAAAGGVFEEFPASLLNRIDDPVHQCDHEKKGDNEDTKCDHQERLVTDKSKRTDDNKPLPSVKYDGRPKLSIEYERFSQNYTDSDTSSKHSSETDSESQYSFDSDIAFNHSTEFDTRSVVSIDSSVCSNHSLNSDISSV